MGGFFNWRPAAAALLVMAVAALVGCECLCPMKKDIRALEDRVAELEETCVTMPEAAGQMFGPVLIERSGPSQVSRGREYQYKIEVTNRADRAVSNVRITEQIPEGLSFVKADPAPVEGKRPPVVWHFEKLEADETKTIQVTAKGTKTGTFRPCALSSYEMPVCAPVTVVQPALELVKTAPGEVLLCEEIPLTFKVTNSGTGTAEGVVVTDTLPEGLVTADGSREVRLEAGDLDSGEFRTLKTRVKAQRAGTFANSATAAAEGDLKAQSNKTTTVVRRPALKLTKTGPARRYIGQKVTYKITVANEGDGRAQKTVVTDGVPAGTTLVSASHGGELRRGTVTWELGTLQPGDSKELELVLRATGKATADNTATAKAVCSEPASASARTEIMGIPAILLEVVDVADPIEVGEEESYVITATNQGSAAARQVKVVVTLEEQMEYVTASGPTRAQVEGRTVTFAPLASLEPGARATWRVRVKAIASGDMRLRVSMTSAQLTRPVEETEATNFYE